MRSGGTRFIVAASSAPMASMNVNSWAGIVWSHFGLRRLVEEIGRECVGADQARTIAQTRANDVLVDVVG